MVYTFLTSFSGFSPTCPYGLIMRGVGEGTWEWGCDGKERTLEVDTFQVTRFFSISCIIKGCIQDGISVSKYEKFYLQYIRNWDSG